MANGTFGGGSGTTTAPYLVEDAADLEAVRKLLAMHYKQVAHIEMLNVENHVPIGSQASPFTGSYDAGEFEIRDFKMTAAAATTTNLGLFGVVSSPGVIRNIKVVRGVVTGPTSGNGENGTIVGRYAGGQALENCHFEGTADFPGSNGNGGVAGSASTEVKKCSFTGTLTFGNGAWNAGVKGFYLGNETNDCHFKGTLSSLGGANGVTAGGTANDCTFDGELIATGTAIGVSAATAVRCSAAGAKVQSTNGSAYGISGGTATDCVSNLAEVSSLSTAPTSFAVGICGGLAIRCVNFSAILGPNAASAYGISYVHAYDCANRGPLVRSEAGNASGVGGCWSSNSGQTIRCYCSADVEAGGSHAAGIVVGDYSTTTTSRSVKNSYFLGNHVKGKGATTANIGRITSVPRTGNADNYSIDTSRIILE